MRLLLFLTFAFICFHFILSQETGKQQFRVMCYNVENYFDCVDDSLTKDEEYLPGGMRGWNYNRYVQKQANIARVVAAVGGWEPPALVGICEVESRKALVDLTRYSTLKNFRYKFAHHESPDARGVDVALLYQPEYFELLIDEPLRIFFPDAPKSTTRDILYVQGRVPTGDTLHVFVCHFPSRLGGELESANKRNQVASILREKVELIFLANHFANILIMGDFNDYPDNQSMQEVLKAIAPEAIGRGSSLYNLMFPLHTAGKGTHKHAGDWGVLDQIIVSGNLLNENSKFHTRINAVHIFDADFLLEDDLKYLGKQPFRTYAGMKYNGGFSDHLPVYLDFFIK